MFKQYKPIALLLLVALQLASCGTLGSVSWYFRGSAVQNNTVLTFNKGDTLQLACKFVQASQGQQMGFYITKGSSAPTKAVGLTTTGTFQEVTLSNPATLVYSDYAGFELGFEHFTVIHSSFGAYGPNFFRYVGIAQLTQQDAGTYHCTVFEYTAETAPTQAVASRRLDVDKGLDQPQPARVARDARSGRNRRDVLYGEITEEGTVSTSGGVTIVVNTKADQADSIRSKPAKFLTYSAAILGASKLLF